MFKMNKKLKDGPRYGCGIMDSPADYNKFLDSK